ncbi:hypothetical protein EDB84DRAFT_1569799 [Lactarius hengduanensis]|nr:hypothetical protein EDB84DRAFT_1569799 [Lactarius hengduanensis]
MHPNRAHALSSPTFLHSPSFFHSPTECAHVPAPPPPQRIIVSAPQVFEPRNPWLARQQARQSPPIPLSLVLAHVTCSRLPVLARVSKRFSAAAQLALYRTLELSADDADACVAQPAGASHLAALATTPALRAYPPLRAAPRTRLTYLALPHFVGVPHAAHDVPPAAALHLAVLDSSHGLAAALAPSHPLRRVTLRTASTLYNGQRPAALFGALGGSCSFSRSTRTCTRGWSLGTLANTSAGLDVLELSLKGNSDEVSLQALYVQVGSLLPIVRALRTLRLRASLPTEAGTAARRVPRCGHACWGQHCVVSGAQWELERGEWAGHLGPFEF